MYVDESTVELKTEYHGTTYYFCSTTCLNQFLAPEKSIRRLKQLVVFSAVLTAPVTFLTYVLLFPPSLNNYVLFALTTPIQFVAGWRFYRGTYDAIRNRMGNMDTLIATGTSAGWVYSSLVTFFPQYVPAPVTYFETAAIIITLILTGNLLEHVTKGRASEAVRKLMDLRPTLAHVLRDGKEQEIPVEQVKLGDVILVRPGERVPVDGTVVDGTSSVDESAVTGESIPVDKKLGSELIGATINKSGFLKFKATKVGQDTVLSQIIQLVEEAQIGRAPIQRLADRISAYFVPFVLAVGLVSGLSWYFLGGTDIENFGRLAFSLAAFITVVIIACPCALGIATPAALMVGTGKGAENGILIKGGEHLERAHKVQTIVFDKTGTLTKGEPSVTDVTALPPFTEDEVLRYAGIAERGSEHPLAKAIVKAAQTKGLLVENPEGFEAEPGEGIKATYWGRKIMVGNRTMMKGYMVDFDRYEPLIRELEEGGMTVTILAVDGKAAGIIGIADTLKDTAETAVKRLKSMRIEVVMLTGDNQRTAKAIAKKLGIERIIAEVLPHQKEEVIASLQREGKVVAMVGDGVNDAPALARADVGIAIGSGTDIAKETGGIILIKADLRDVVTAIQLSKRTVAKIRQNLFWAFAYNTALIPIGAGLLVPFLGPEVYLVLPFLAAGAMAFSSVTVVSNSLLLRRFRPSLGTLMPTRMG